MIIDENLERAFFIVVQSEQSPLEGIGQADQWIIVELMVSAVSSATRISQDALIEILDYFKRIPQNKRKQVAQEVEDWASISFGFKCSLCGEEVEGAIRPWLAVHAECLHIQYDNGDDQAPDWCLFCASANLDTTSSECGSSRLYQCGRCGKSAVSYGAIHEL